MANSLIDSMTEEFVARRVTYNDRDLLRVIIETAKILADWLSTSPCCYAGFPGRFVDFEESSIAQYLEQTRSSDLFDEFRLFSLSDHPTKPRIFLFYLETEINDNLVQGIYFPLLWSVHNKNLLKIDLFSKVSLEICKIFDADFGWVRDYKISRLFQRSIREYNYNISRSSIKEQNYVISPSLPLGIEQDPLPELLFSSEFDQLKVPDGIQWVNYWSSPVVDRIGREKVQRAPWSRQYELENRAMFLVPTEEMLNVKNGEHLRILDEIVEKIELRKIQDQYRL